MEMWKAVPEFEKYIEVSNLGNVRTVERYVLQGKHKDRPRLISSRLIPIKLCREGYPIIDLSLDNKRFTKHIHQLVALVFLEAPKNGESFINHKNGIKTDNRVDNLEWCTHQHNILESYRLGLSLREEKHLNSKLKKEQVLEILKSNESFAELGRKYGVTGECISKIKKRKTWKHVE